jgi:hypothetical protein
MALLKKTLKGTTLVESLVALVIMTVCFGISSYIYVNVTGSQNDRLRFKAWILLNDVSKNLKDPVVGEDVFKDEDMTIEKKISKYEDNESTGQLSLKAKDKSGNVLAELNQIIAITK